MLKLDGHSKQIVQQLSSRVSISVSSLWKVRATSAGCLRDVHVVQNRALLASKLSLASQSSADGVTALAPDASRAAIDTSSAPHQIMLPVSRSSSHLLDSPPVVLANGTEARQHTAPMQAGDSPASRDAERAQDGFDELIR